MNITKVKYERLFPCGAYLNEKIGFEAELGVIASIGNTIGDDELRAKPESPERAIEYLRQLAEDIHKEKYPHFYQDNKPNYLGDENQQQTIQPKDERIQSFIATINMCTNLKFLKNFETRVHQENNQELLDAYNKKLSEFL